MRILKTNPVLTILNSYLVDSPQPSTISYLWNFGSLLGLSLVAQIITGILLAMHYTGTAELGFNSVEHIMRDVNDGWLLRISHANMASFFFIAVYLHISRGLYYGSYRSPRIGVWVIGTLIFFLMMATAFLGYVLPYGQMSLWGIYKYSTNNLINNEPDKKFMAMFLGLVDGDGYIEIGPQKQYQKKTKLLVRSTIRARLVIRLNNRDTELLIYISERLKVGSISILHEINQTRLIFSKKDLTTVILPLINKYNLQFLIYNRLEQFKLLKYILKNNIKYWDKVNTNDIIEKVTVYSPYDLLQLDFFSDWIIGFTMAEGSFSFKKDGSAFYQIKQKGLNNFHVIKAICLAITNREIKSIKPDRSDCYQLTLTSKSDVNKVLSFFSSSENISLIGFKLIQYNTWINNLKNSNRYKYIKFFS